MGEEFNMEYQGTVYYSPIGKLYLRIRKDLITDVSFLPMEFHDIGGSHWVLKELIIQLELYFNGKLKTFSVPYILSGTEFQKKCYQILEQIPYGQTISYQEEAILLGDKKKARACGMANHHNRLPILVPCHRVIGKNGDLTGYAGGMDKKAFLIELEKQESRKGQVL